MDDCLPAVAINFDEASLSESSKNIPVYLRMKPIKSEELSIKILDPTTVETNHACRSNKKATFSHVFDGKATQQDVFEITTASLVDKFLDGANVMTFAYGVTSSGKTHTILGSSADPGVIPRALEKMFGSYKSKIENSLPTHKPLHFDSIQELSMSDMDSIGQLKQSLLAKATKYTHLDYNQMHFHDATREISDPRISPIPKSHSCVVWISLYEIYNEVITDLLQTSVKLKKNRIIGQDAKGRTFVKDLIQVPVQNAGEAFALLHVAKQNLHKATTNLNENSSRSHMVFNIKMVHSGGSLTEPVVNQFVISDLAGSERQTKTGTKGIQLKQAGAINNSLLVLGRCLESLRKKDKSIAAPFRDSKLTRMLNPFFTQGGYVSLIICINPDLLLQDETIDTIRFSAIASEVVHAPERPVDRLRQLHRLSMTCQNSPRKNFNDDSVIEYWEDAVRPLDKQGYVEVKSKYFNDMARDILRAEKALTSNEEEITRLKELLRIEKDAHQQQRYMYQDKMADMRNTHREVIKERREREKEDREELEEEHEKETEELKGKYLKYKNEYGRLSGYVRDKLWPEVDLFRERFGCLPEFPPKKGSSDDEEENDDPPEQNSIKYWQDKLKVSELNVDNLTKQLAQKSDEVSRLIQELVEEQDSRETLEVMNAENFQNLEKMTKAFEAATERLLEINMLRDEKGQLIDDVAEWKTKVQEAEEAHEGLLAEHAIELDGLLEEVESLKQELRASQQELEFQAEKDARGAIEVSSLKETITSLEEAMSRSSDSEKKFKVLALEKEKLAAKLSKVLKEKDEFMKETVSLQDDVVRMEEELEGWRERQTNLVNSENNIREQMEEVREIMAANCQDDESLKDQLRKYQLQEDHFREELAEKQCSLQSQDAEIDELRSKLDTMAVLVEHLNRLSEDNEGLRKKIKEVSNEKERLFKEVNTTRQLQVEVEFLTSKLEHEKKRTLREAQGDSAVKARRPGRPRRSLSTSEVEKSSVFKEPDSILSRPATGRRNRRILLSDESVSMNDTLDSIMDKSSRSTPYRTRSRNPRD